MALDNILESARRALTKSDKGKASEMDDEHGQRRPLLSLSPRQSFGPPPPRGDYGAATDVTRPTHEHGPARRSGSYLGPVVEEPEEVDEEEVFQGTYTRAVFLYTLIPFALSIVFLLLVIVPRALRRLSLPSAHPPLLVHPLPSLLIPVAFYALSHVLRQPTYFLLSSLLSFTYPNIAPALSTTLHVALHTVLRLLSVPLLLSTVPPSIRYGGNGHPSHHDTIFPLVWYLSLGWAAAEVTASVAQGYAQLALYRDVFFPTTPSTDDISATEAERFQAETDPLSLSRVISGDYARPRVPSPSALLDEELERLTALDGRQELEELYGVPLIRIPTFIQLLQRLAALLLSLGLTLVLSSAYLRWINAFHQHLHITTSTAQPSGKHALTIALPVTFALHLVLALLHTPPILAGVGAHAAAYTSLVVGLGALFAGLGMWEVLD